MEMRNSEKSPPLPPMSNVPRASLPEIDSETGTGTGSGGGVGVGAGVGVGRGNGSWAKASVAFPSAKSALAIKIDRMETRPIQPLLTACAVRLRTSLQARDAPCQGRVFPRSRYAYTYGAGRPRHRRAG